MLDHDDTKTLDQDKTQPPAQHESATPATGNPATPVADEDQDTTAAEIDEPSQAADADGSHEQAPDLNGANDSSVSPVEADKAVSAIDDTLVLQTQLPLQAEEQPRPEDQARDTKPEADAQDESLPTPSKELVQVPQTDVEELSADAANALEATPVPPTQEDKGAEDSQEPDGVEPDTLPTPQDEKEQLTSDADKQQASDETSQEVVATIDDEADGEGDATEAEDDAGEVCVALAVVDKKIDDTVYFEAIDITDDEEDTPRHIRILAERRPLLLAGSVARKSKQTLSDALGAFRNVHEASRRHAEARDELLQLEDDLEKHKARLRRRLKIEENYDAIMAEKSRAWEQAQHDMELAEKRRQDLEQQRNKLEMANEQLRRDNEEKLRPYAELAESSKARADDAAEALYDLRRKTRAAESALNEATRNRDLRVANANRAVDDSLDRMRYARAEYDALLAGGGDPQALEEVERVLVSEQAYLDAARADVDAITNESRAQVEQAQQDLFDIRRLAAQAERDADSAAEEAAKQRDAYDAVVKQMQADDRAQTDLLRQCTAAHEQALQDIRNANKRRKEAKEALDKAQSVHDNPQVTDDLRAYVHKAQTQIDAQQSTVETLASEEHDLRKGTLGQRIAIIAIAVLIVLVFLVIIIMLLPR